MAESLPSFRLDGRIAIVTGAGIGIGRAIAEAFAAAGAHLLLAGRTEARLADLKAVIEADGGRADVLRTDVTRLADVRALGEVARTLATSLDRHLVLVNNAGFGFTKPALEVSEQDWDALIDTHLKGTFFCCQQVGRTMLERGYGKIINMSSAWAASTDANKAPYCAAKAGISHMTAALSTEWAPRGVRVNALAPTATLTEFTANVMASNPERAERLRSRIKLGRFAMPADHIGAALFLASEASDFVTGHTLFTDGGLTAGG